MITKPRDILSYRFKYNGEWRHVDNVTWEDNYQTLIGFEVRKSGKFRYRVKRYKLVEVQSSLQRIPPQMNRKHYQKIANKKNVSYKLNARL